MGATLSEPVKDKVVEEHEDENYDIGAVAMQGWRTEMEDAHVAQSGLQSDPDAAVFAVFDGHCGSEVSRFAARYLPGQLEKTQGWQEGDVKRGLRDTFLRLDQALLHVETQPFLKGVAINADKAAAQGLPSRPAEKWPSALAYADEHMAVYPPEGLAQPNLDTHHLAAKVQSLVNSKIRLGTAAGCTAVAAVVRRGLLTVANAGDSRCVLSRGGLAVEMSSDHKPELPEEMTRIEEAGGFVRNGRTCGNLSLSRALGDFEFKRNGDIKASQQMITALPEIREQQLQEDDEFLILACDGIWENLSSQQVVDFVREQLKGGASPAEAGAALCDHCLAPTLYSNVAARSLAAGGAGQLPGVGGEPVSCARQDADAEEADPAEPPPPAADADSMYAKVTAAIDSVNAEAAAVSRNASETSEPAGIASANGQPAPADIDPKVGPAPDHGAGDDGECNPWDAFAAAMQLMKEKPDASEEEIAAAVTACSSGGGADDEPEQMQAAVTQQLKAAPRPMGPDSKEGYGCDNMSVLIVQLKDRVKTRARLGSQQNVPTASGAGLASSRGSLAAASASKPWGQPAVQWAAPAAACQRKCTSAMRAGRALRQQRVAAQSPRPATRPAAAAAVHRMQALHVAARRMVHLRV